MTNQQKQAIQKTNEKPCPYKFDETYPEYAEIMQKRAEPEKTDVCFKVLFGQVER